MDNFWTYAPATWVAYGVVTYAVSLHFFDNKRPVISWGLRTYFIFMGIINIVAAWPIAEGLALNSSDNNIWHVYAVLVGAHAIGVLNIAAAIWVVRFGKFALSTLVVNIAISLVSSISVFHGNISAGVVQLIALLIPAAIFATAYKKCYYHIK